MRTLRDLGSNRFGLLQLFLSEVAFVLVGQLGSNSGSSVARDISRLSTQRDNALRDLVGILLLVQVHSLEQVGGGNANSLAALQEVSNILLVWSVSTQMSCHSHHHHEGRIGLADTLDGSRLQLVNQSIHQFRLQSFLLTHTRFCHSSNRP